MHVFTYILNMQLKCLGFWRQRRSLVSLDKVNCLAPSSGHVILHCVSCAPRIDDRVECLHAMRAAINPALIPLLYILITHLATPTLQTYR